MTIPPQELAWREGEASTVALMGTLNAATAELVRTIRMLLDTSGWVGAGSISSPEQWVTWKAGVSHHRAAGLVDIARRMHELPACWARFERGGFTEDAMVRIARRVPTSHDEEVARRAPDLLIRQLERVLSILPPLPEVEGARQEPRSGRHLTTHRTAEGWMRGRFCLPPDEAAVVEAGLQASRDAEYRDRQGLEAGADLDGDPAHRRRAGVTEADAFVRMSSEAADALDRDLGRTGYRGERHKVVLHVELGPDGQHAHAQLHLGPSIRPALARFLSCDAEVIVAAHQAGQLVGITPTVRTPNRHLRRLVERRDQGCAHPLCRQRRWLHIHRIDHWEYGGQTVPHNLVCLCPTHHRALHQGEFTIEGDPEAGTLRFFDTWGRPLEPPGTGPPRLPDPSQPPTTEFRPPLAEQLHADYWDWNSSWS